ncbi:Beta-lactamase 1 [Frankliniella fusca]|uniref:Beta-lactamase 1 n=1 Tax=Frankliniella fusca TaxID=407009 RepID=A0AAE1I2G5_9NEOP|nr:Beta-lactamase 1 [Frankliniella fusca]
MGLQEDLSASIRTVLAHLDDLTLDLLVDFLISQGVKKMQDLRRITIELLKQHLDHVDSSDLYEEWQKKYSLTAADPRTSSAARNSEEAMHLQPSTSKTPQEANAASRGGREALSTLQSNAQQIIEDLPVFSADSPYMPYGVKQAIAQKKRPSTVDREQMVARIVDRCREVVPNLTRSTFNEVAQKIVSMYPNSFRDTIAVSDHGSDSLAYQLKNEYDNDKRPYDRRLSKKEKEAPPVAEATGCSKWNPQIPEDETEDSLLKLQQDLKKMHKVSSKNWEWNLIKRKLTSSFYLQRKEINGELANTSNANAKSKKPSRKRKRTADDDEDVDEPEAQPYKNLSIKEIQSNWPFLFTAKGINIHFEMLTERDFSSSLDRYISDHGSKLIDYLASRNDELLRMKRKMDLAERQAFGSVVLSTLLLMLVKFFKEERDHFIMFVVRTTELDEAAELIVFPDSKTPVLICAGPNIFDYDKIFFASDNQVLCTASNLAEGLTLLFTSHFVFNYVYSPKLLCFLTFIQRYGAFLK